MKLHSSAFTITHLFKILLIGLSIFYLVMWLVSSVLRLALPYELTNYEYQSLTQVIRVINLQSIYTSPSLEYVPMIYAPLYYYVSALFVVLFGPSFFSIRLVSFTATLCTLTMLYLIAKKETGSSAYGIIAAGFFAACYEIGGSSYEVARVDSLALMFFVISIYFVKLDKFGYKYLIGGICFVLACVTKQTYLLYLVPILLLINPKGYVVQFLFTSFLLIVVVAVGFNISSDGWFFYYVAGLPTKHRLYESVFGRTVQVAFVYRYFFGLFAVVFISLVRQKIDRSARLVVATGISVIVSFMLTLKNGGSNNMMFPSFALVGIMFPQALYRMKNRVTISITCLLLYSLFLYFPPYGAEEIYAKKEQWGDSVSAVRSIKGEVLFLSDPWLVYSAGKTPTAHIDPIGDIMGEWGDRQPTSEGEKIILELRENIMKKKYSVIALTARDEKSIFIRSIRGVLEVNYTRQDNIHKTGYFPRGLTFYTPKDP